MDEIKVEVAGSSGSRYEVQFVREDAQVYAYCTCKAGVNGLHCKHRVALLAGDRSAVTSSNVTELEALASWLPGSDLAAALDEFEAADREAKAANSRLSKAKKILAGTMRG